MSIDQPSLETLTLRQLRQVASEYDIPGYSRMRKTELIDAIRAIEAQRGQVPAPAVATSPMVIQAQVKASKYIPPLEALVSLDKGLPDLPGGYGESRIVLMPRDPQCAYTYWDIPLEHKEELRRQGGARLALRFYDVTDIDLNYQAPHSLQQYQCDEMARDWYLPIPVSDRDYVVEIGYLCNDGRWLVMARSLPVHIPPVYPSDWIEDHFMTVTWDQDLRGKTLMPLTRPGDRAGAGYGIYEKIFDLAESVEAQRVAGSLFGSMQHVPGSVITSFAVPVSSYVFPSGVGMWALPTVSGLTMSGVGFSASMPPLRARQFWLIANAELIVYGTTEPDATVTIGGKPIKLNPDGTFRFQMPFHDGLIDYPIMAVAADGEQNRSIHMKFARKTSERRTNTKNEAEKEIWTPEGWFTINELKNQVLREIKELNYLYSLQELKSLDDSKKREIEELEQEYEIFLDQPRLLKIFSPAFAQLRKKQEKGCSLRYEEIVDLVAPLVFESAVRGDISIPQSLKLPRKLARFVEDVRELFSNTIVGEDISQDSNIGSSNTNVPRVDRFYNKLESQLSKNQNIHTNEIHEDRTQ